MCSCAESFPCIMTVVYVTSDNLATHCSACPSPEVQSPLHQLLCSVQNTSCKVSTSCARVYSRTGAPSGYTSGHIQIGLDQPDPQETKINTSNTTEGLFTAIVALDCQQVARLCRAHRCWNVVLGGNRMLLHTSTSGKGGNYLLGLLQIARNNFCGNTFIRGL